jgi:hypothetical protein
LDLSFLQSLVVKDRNLCAKFIQDGANACTALDKVEFFTPKTTDKVDKTKVLDLFMQLANLVGDDSTDSD